MIWNIPSNTDGWRIFSVKTDQDYNPFWLLWIKTNYSLFFLWRSKLQTLDSNLSSLQEGSVSYSQWGCLCSKTQAFHYLCNVPVRSKKAFQGKNPKKNFVWGRKKDLKLHYTTFHLVAAVSVFVALFLSHSVGQVHALKSWWAVYLQTACILRLREPASVKPPQAVR